MPEPEVRDEPDGLVASYHEPDTDELGITDPEADPDQPSLFERDGDPAEAQERARRRRRGDVEAVTAEDAGPTRHTEN